MAIELSTEQRKEAIASIERYFRENMDEKIGNIAAGALLGYFLEVTRANAALRPLRGPDARQTARISGGPLRGQSVDLQSKCRRFRSTGQWKRFACSAHGMEAYFLMHRLRNGFLLCRCLAARTAGVLLVVQ